MQHCLMIVVATAGTAATQLMGAPPVAVTGPSYAFKTWQEAIEKAPCDAFIHVAPHGWKISGTIIITEGNSRSNIISSDNYIFNANPGNARGSYTHDTFINSPLFASLDIRCAN